MRLTEPIVLVHHVAGLGGARRRRLAASGVVTGPLTGLERVDVLLCRIVFRRGSDTDIDESRLILKRTGHALIMEMRNFPARIEDEANGRHI